MPRCFSPNRVSHRRFELPAPSCAHEYVRTEKWSESETTETRATDDFGRKGPIRRRRMTTTYEKYRCRLCGHEDIESYTNWVTLGH